MYLTPLYIEIIEFLENHTSEGVMNADIFNSETLKAVINFDATGNMNSKTSAFVAYMMENSYFYQLTESEIDDIKKLTPLI